MQNHETFSLNQLWAGVIACESGSCRTLNQRIIGMTWVQTSYLPTYAGRQKRLDFGGYPSALVALVARNYGNWAALSLEQLSTHSLGQSGELERQHDSRMCPGVRRRIVTFCGVAGIPGTMPPFLILEVGIIIWLTRFSSFQGFEPNMLTYVYDVVSTFVCCEDSHNVTRAA